MQKQCGHREDTEVPCQLPISLAIFFVIVFGDSSLPRLGPLSCLGIEGRGIIKGLPESFSFDWLQVKIIQMTKWHVLRKLVLNLQYLANPILESVSFNTDFCNIIFALFLYNSPSHSPCVFLDESWGVEKSLNENYPHPLPPHPTPFYLNSQQPNTSWNTWFLIPGYTLNKIKYNEKDKKSKAFKY